MPRGVLPTTSTSTACPAGYCRFRKAPSKQTKHGSKTMQARGYLELKLSWELFHKGPEALTEPERHRLDDVARKQDSIEQRILASAASANVVVPAATLASRIAEIRQRYPSAGEFTQDLERCQMSMADLEQA